MESLQEKDHIDFDFLWPLHLNCRSWNLQWHSSLLQLLRWMGDFPIRSIVKTGVTWYHLCSHGSQEPHYEVNGIQKCRKPRQSRARYLVVIGAPVRCFWRATSLIFSESSHSGSSLPLIFCIHVCSGPIYWGGYLPCKKIIRWWSFTCKKPENIICDGVLHVNMFHYFKIPYFTCTFFTKFTYNEYIGSYFLSHIVLQFSPVNSPRVDTVSPPTRDPDQGVVGFSHSFMNSLGPLSPQKLCVLELAKAAYLRCPRDHLPDPLHEFEVPWHKPYIMTLGNIYAWIWVFSVSTTRDLPQHYQSASKWKIRAEKHVKILRQIQAIKGRWSTYMCAHFKHQTQEIMFART
jgi:hypothetical protein